MIGTILVPTDGSEHADKAVSLAGDLAQMHDAKIILLHAVPDIINETIPEGHQDHADAERLHVGDILIAIGERILKEAEARLRNRGVERIETTVPSGRPAQAILDYAKVHAVDMIVMGNRGLSPVQGMMLGSVSHKVSHLAPCNCVIVR